MTTTGTPPPLLVAAVAAILSVSVASAVGFTPPLPDAQVTAAAPSSSTTTSTTLPDAAAADTTDAATVTTTATVATPAAVSTTALAPAGGAKPGEARQPKAGVYRYLVAVEDDEDIAKVEIRSPSPGRFDLTDHDLEQTDHVAWSAGGVTILSTESDGTCDWQPDITALRFPMSVGSQWSADSRCRTTSEDGTSEIHVTATWRVARAERVEVDHVPVDVWVVEEQATIDIIGTYDGEQHNLRQDERATSRFSPQHGLNVSVDVTRTYVQERGTPDEDSFDEKEHRELMGLTPRP